MPERSSDNSKLSQNQDLLALLNGSQKFCLLLFNTIPLLQVLLAIALYFLLPFSPVFRLLLTLLYFYLLPPLIARIALLIRPIPQGSIQPGSQDFFCWWLVLNLQNIFNRFSFFEELLRLIPQAYSLWLRLWGAKIGRYTYWSPGVNITDRTFIEIGDDVIIGIGTKIVPHIFIKNEQGKLELILATIKIGDRSIVGGFSNIAAGSKIMPDEMSRATVNLTPFTKWENGKRYRKQKTESGKASDATP